MGERGLNQAGGGYAVHLDRLPYYRGTSVQVCGLWPFGTATQTPEIGAPIGPHLITGSMVCFDHISWFMEGLISNPTMFLIGNIGLGKSSFARRLCLYQDYVGAINLVPGDIKPDYVDTIKALDGHVIRLTDGQPCLNPLDIPGADDALEQLSSRGEYDLHKKLKDSIFSRKLNAVAGLITIVRRAEITEREDLLLSTAINELEAQAGIPTLRDLLNLLQTGSEKLMSAADVVTRDEYNHEIRALKTSLTNLVSERSIMGGVFSGHTKEHLSLDRHMVYDISSLTEADKRLVAAAFFQCTNETFAAVNIANALADAGVNPQRRYNIVQDELWRQLSAAPGMVDRLDTTQRLVRSYGVGQVQITHSVSDLDALSSVEERKKAEGFIAKSGAIVTCGLANEGAKALARIRNLTEQEISQITSWQDPPGWVKKREQNGGGVKAPPGLGKFLIKVGSRPGIPVQLQLTPDELAIYDTNKRWKKEVANDENI